MIKWRWLCMFALAMPLWASGCAWLVLEEPACTSGETCPGDFVCDPATGLCLTPCPPGSELCDGMCVNPQQNNSHCGACGEVCGDGEVCAAGECAATCGPGISTCEGECVDTDIDPAHCGACGNACAADGYCVGGACAATCAPGTEPCGGICRDTASDPDHCGGCGLSCGEGELCEAGACTCPSGLDECAGTCIDFDSEPAHCGACGNACLDGQNCVDGACACPAGTTLCGGACVNLDTDAEHCGVCENQCGSACSGGACVCVPGQTYCDGACTDLGDDDAHCGACGNACGGGMSCEGGACECPAGFTECGGECKDLERDVLSCGSCGNACDSGESCVEGQCVSPFTGTRTALPLPNGCSAFPLSPDECGTPIATETVPFEFDDLDETIIYNPDEPFASNESLVLSGDARSFDHGGALGYVGFFDEGEHSLTQRSILAGSSWGAFSLGIRSGIRSCARPSSLRFWVRFPVLDIVATLVRTTLTGKYNTGGIGFFEATSLQINPETGETCDQVCGYISMRCDDTQQWYRATIPPRKTLALEIALRSSGSTYFNVAVFRTDESQIFHAASGSVGGSYGFYTARLRNNLDIPQDVVLSVIPWNGDGVHYQIAAAIEQ